MRATLFPFQETALAELHEKIQKAHAYWSEKDPQVISFTAPTGARVIIVTGCINALVSRVSETFIKNLHLIFL
jgi:type III restriction enzyme